MSERTDIVQQIIDLKRRKSELAALALEATLDGDTAKADEYDEDWDKADDEIAPLQDRLWEILEDEALREAELDREYGAWTTGP